MIYGIPTPMLGRSQTSRQRVWKQLSYTWKLILVNHFLIGEAGHSDSCPQ